MPSHMVPVNLLAPIHPQLKCWMSIPRWFIKIISGIFKRHGFGSSWNNIVISKGVTILADIRGMTELLICQ